MSVARRTIELDGCSAILVDLPGTFTLSDESAGLPSFWRYLVAAQPDAILAVGLAAGAILARMVGIA